jgi:hypothetical protein
VTVLVVVGVGLLGGVGALGRFLLDGAVAARAASAFRGGRWRSTSAARSPSGSCTAPA